MIIILSKVLNNHLLSSLWILVYLKLNKNHLKSSDLIFKTVIVVIINTFFIKE